MPLFKSPFFYTIAYCMPGSWAGPFWFGLGGQGPGPDPFSLARGPGSWAGPAYTINTLDSDKDANINTFSTNDLLMMLI